MGKRRGDGGMASLNLQGIATPSVQLLDADHSVQIMHRTRDCGAVCIENSLQRDANGRSLLSWSVNELQPLTDLPMLFDILHAGRFFLEFMMHRRILCMSCMV